MDSIDPENVIQNLDSLWFFSNVLLSTNPPLSLQKQIKQNSNVTRISHLESPSSKSPTYQNLHHQSPPPKTSSLAKISPEKSDNDGIHDVDSRSLRANAKIGREGDRSSKPNRRPKKITCNNVEGFCYGYDKGLFEMPSCNDGKAMKKQLRTWAIAVAYTVLNNTNSLMMVACS